MKRLSKEANIVYKISLDYADESQRCTDVLRTVKIISGIEATWFCLRDSLKVVYFNTFYIYNSLLC